MRRSVCIVQLSAIDVSSAVSGPSSILFITEFGPEEQTRL